MNFFEGEFYLAPDVHHCGGSIFLFHWHRPHYIAPIAQIMQEDDLQAKGQRKAAVNVVVRPARVACEQTYVCRLPARAGFFPGTEEAA